MSQQFVEGFANVVENESREPIKFLVPKLDTKKIVRGEYGRWEGQGVLLVV
jgi:hypothetical protein